MGSQSTDFIAVLDSVSHASFKGDELERLRVRAAARRLLARVESPYERAWGFCFEQPIVFAALQTCIELGIWKTWTEIGGGEKTIDQLVKLAKTEVAPNLLRRLFRLLSAFYVVEETGVDTFQPTPFSLAIGDESTKVRASLEAANNQYILASHNLPKYLSQIGYVEPTAADNNNHSASDPDSLNFFSRLQASPKYYSDFTGHMEAWTAWKTPWTTIYPPSRLLSTITDPSTTLSPTSPFIVDLGGNTGIDITHVLTSTSSSTTPLPQGTLILQDLPEIITLAKQSLPESHLATITPMAHDFFTPQPVRHARAYFMHAVLHDWPDDKATVILNNTREAMKKGYSSLFVYDIVLPDQGTSISQATMDVNMMSLLSAAERTKAKWEALLTGAGLKVVKFWPDPQEYEMLIECEVA